jgi:hypothetical protein
MTIHLYLSLMPEALIASMLPPEEFGDYYAVGTHKKLHGQAMFAELDPDFRHPFFRVEEGLARCVPHGDGSPKKSVYISAYRVLEHIALDAIRKFYLVTAYGKVLGLDRADYAPEPEKSPYHLYQEIAPLQPMVVSTLNPMEFYGLITQDPSSLIHLPAISFVELRLGALAEDPEYGEVGDLPYTFIHHLRECLLELRDKSIQSKMVNRVQPVEFPYRVITNGIFIGTQKELTYYPLPSRDELRSKHFRWWRSANM